MPHHSNDATRPRRKPAVCVTARPPATGRSRAAPARGGPTGACKALSIPLAASARLKLAALPRPPARATEERPMMPSRRDPRPPHRPRGHSRHRPARSSPIPHAGATTTTPRDANGRTCEGRAARAAGPGAPPAPSIARPPTPARPASTSSTPSATSRDASVIAGRKWTGTPWLLSSEAAARHDRGVLRRSARHPCPSRPLPVRSTPLAVARTLIASPRTLGAGRHRPRPARPRPRHLRRRLPLLRRRRARPSPATC